MNRVHYRVHQDQNFYKLDYRFDESETCPKYPKKEVC